MTCECQPCEKLHAYIRGRVFSSHAHRPVVLAAVLLGAEIVAFTDENGKFFFKLTTVKGEVSLLIREVRHRQVEVELNLRSSLTPDIAVTMEYIEDVLVVDKLQQGFHMELGNKATSEMTGINASVSVPPRSLLGPKSYEVYQGPGHVLHSLYHMDSRPEFNSAAIQSMVYRDSKGVDFSIQSHISGSLRVVGETGKSLSLKQGSYALISVDLRFDDVVESSQIEGLHIFTYPDSSSHWMDNGKVMIDSVQQSIYSTRVMLHAKLRKSNLFWAIGFPSRITCYIKSKISHLATKQELVGIAVQLEQSMFNLDRPSFYLASAKSVAGEGVCLKAVCGLGGLLYIKDTAVGEEVKRLALTPSTDHSVIMGNHDQVMFYDVDMALVTGDTRTPYYPTLEECIASRPHGNQELDSGHFEFLVNISLPSPSPQLLRIPSVILPVLNESKASFDPLALDDEYCYIKVGVYDCSQYTNIQVLSFSPINHTHLLSMFSETLPPSTEVQLDEGKCPDTSVMQLRAACVRYTCGSDVHVSMSWLPGQDYKSSSDDSAQQSCRYWSSNSGLTDRMHLSNSMTSFHLVDRGSEYGGRGLYRAFGKDLVLLQCQSGDVNKPAKIMDHRNGMAVTFIC